MARTPAVWPPPPDGDWTAADFAEFRERLSRRMGLRLADYKPEQMQRRIATMAQRAGFRSFLAYGSALEADATRLAEFVDRLTIHVSEFVRNPERFDDLTRAILPDLLSQNVTGPLRVWSAGCSYGAEPYTLALLLHELAPERARQIVGTDVDAGILDKARAARFSAAEMAGVSDERRAGHFTRIDDSYEARPHLQEGMEFQRHDLLCDPYPRAAYDLIACRNVVIYFTEPAKIRVFQGLRQALRPGGVLFVGGTERLSDHRALGFEMILPFFYRKVA